MQPSRVHRRGTHTPSNESASSRCRGTMVTSSISHRKAISGGVKPGGSGNAMTATREAVVEFECSVEGRRRVPRRLPNVR
jgi:hypothetical protein